MTTSESVLRAIAIETIEARHPVPTSLDDIYAVVRSRVTFDADDLGHPHHKGVPRPEPNWQRNTRNALQAEKEAFRVVNCDKALWRLPTPSPPELWLDPHQAWQRIHAAAERYSVDGRVFASPARGVRFRVAGVDADAVLIERIDANETARLSSELVARAIGRLNAAGGRTGARTLIYTVAQEVALVELHPGLRWEDSGRFIAVVAKMLSLAEPLATEEEDELAIVRGTLGAEGVERLLTHRRRERDSSIIREFKRQYRDSHGGTMPCEVCGFRFDIAFGGLGDGYIEAHHRVPLSAADPSLGTVTRFIDIAFLCGNCHRMLHRPLGSKYLTVEELRALRGTQAAEDGVGSRS